jgi:DnaJ-class molecular chaperone
MMSIERLYSRECPKSLTGEPTKPGLNPMTGADILNILAQVQHHEPVGNMILQAKIQLDANSRSKLVQSFMLWLHHDKSINILMSALIAENAIHEVCDTRICDKCKGVGELIYKKERKLIQCAKCQGVGRILLTTKQLYLRVNRQRPTDNKITYEQFNELYYPVYMGAVDRLHVAESSATRFAHEIMDRLEKDWAA